MTVQRCPHKAKIRSGVLALRDAIPVDQRIEKSLALSAHGGRELVVGPNDIVSGFWPIRSEVDVRPLMADLRDQGARLCLPVIVDRETIIFRELLRGAPMVDTGFGTAGPADDAAVLDPTLMLVPLAAFDARGHRVGYGAGLYDRAISRLVARHIRPRLVGIAFDLQEVEGVPDEDHDELLDAVLTESGLRCFAPSI
ncbi:5-formyltetrahydrofolate cyclo-ligase [Pararhizobium haloflavum]|uniref:5-formyltetrahydrofolate cyclo-ligase n=1 Tax=Pararhizobium haloflavum TaxID=2037914 RepID=UPI000C183219|nr:5-formyltetrahydrofolate cyclo-ligase [Pararhizobium haloflavum]